MTKDEGGHIDRVEAKVDRVLTILDDPDFGVRVSLKDHERRIRSTERWRYAMPAALITAVSSVILTFVHSH